MAKNNRPRVFDTRITIRISKALRTELERLAKKDNRSVANLVQKILQDKTGVR